MTGVTERRPNARAGWQSIACPRVTTDNAQILTASAWQSGSVLVVSSLDRGDPTVAESGTLFWHVSISENGARASRPAVRRMLADFGMQGAEEVTRAGGAVRQFSRVAVAPHAKGFDA